MLKSLKRQYLLVKKIFWVPQCLRSCFFRVTKHVYCNTSMARAWLLPILLAGASAGWEVPALMSFQAIQPKMMDGHVVAAFRKPG